MILRQGGTASRTHGKNSNRRNESARTGRTGSMSKPPKNGHIAESNVSPIVITTNRAFRDWGKTFDTDNTLATAIIDRLMHHGEAIVIDGRSYRTPENNHS